MPRPLPPGHTRPADDIQVEDHDRTNPDLFRVPDPSFNAGSVVCRAHWSEKVEGLLFRFGCIRTEPGHLWHVDASRTRSW